MKNLATNKAHCFENWRIQNAHKYGNFIWPQINYDFNSAETISIVFEQRKCMNESTQRYDNFWDKIKCKNIQYFVMNFLDEKADYYVEPSEIKDIVGLILKKNDADLLNITTYWDYRLATNPINCLTADIDSLEFTKNKNYVAIEAAQLFETNSFESAIGNIFRTFKWRKNEVNPPQYLSQYRFSQLVDGYAFILFHKISNDNTLDYTSHCFLLKNNESFYNMLCFIRNECEKNDENKFRNTYSEFLKNNLQQFNNIYDAYDYIKSL